MRKERPVDAHSLSYVIRANEVIGRSVAERIKPEVQYRRRQWRVETACILQTTDLS